MNSFLNAYFSIMLLFMHLLSQTTPATAIHSPVGGQALQGIVQILGTTSIEGFRSSELSFAYLVNPTDTWFKISESEVPVENGVIADWDTTTISDGDYILRLVIKLDDGNELMSSVDGLRVRNYSPIEAETPTVTVPKPTLRASETITPTLTPSITPIPSSTPVAATFTALPPNPAELSQVAVLSSIGMGIVATVGLFVVLGILYGIRALVRSR